MTLIADILLVAGALAAGFYCFVLSRRLTAFKDAESGVGQVVASLSRQVDDLNTSIESARVEANSSSTALSELTQRGEGVAQRLELMVASMHDIPTPQTEKKREDQPIFSTTLPSTRRSIMTRNASA